MNGNFHNRRVIRDPLAVMRSWNHRKVEGNILSSKRWNLQWSTAWWLLDTKQAPAISPSHGCTSCSFKHLWASSPRMWQVKIQEVRNSQAVSKVYYSLLLYFIIVVLNLLLPLTCKLNFILCMCVCICMCRAKSILGSVLSTASGFCQRLSPQS